jgi:rubrerythrin
MLWKDGPTRDATDSVYECFECGTVVEETTIPTACPDCDGEVRNRGTPME